MCILRYKKKVFSKVLKGCFLLLSMGLYFACQSDDTPPAIEDSINGFWLVADKGYVFEFTDGKDVIYNTNAKGCSIYDEEFKPEHYLGLKLNLVSENEMIGTSDLIASEIKFTRLLSQNPLCLPDQISATEDPKINFDHFWNIFNDYYAFFETRNVDWSQYESLRDQVTTDNFYDTLGELVFLFEDGHVGLFDQENGIEINSGLPKLAERLNTNLSGDLVIETLEDYAALFSKKKTTIVAKYLEGSFETDERENIIWGLINNEIGYINILRMDGYGTNYTNELETLNSVLDTVMNDLKDSGVSKLIIDIRFNEGGSSMVSLNIVSRFMDQERFGFAKKARLGDGFTENKSFFVKPGGNFQFTDDIVLLTSPITASAADLFTLCMKDLPHVTIVGENTNGSFSSALSHILPNGAVVELSNEIYSDAEGVVYEAIGIGPLKENRIPLFANIDFEKEKDSGIDKAIDLLNN